MVICVLPRRVNEYYITREQIGTALNYEHPRIAIQQIHDRNRDRLDPLSGVCKMNTPGGTQDVLFTPSAVSWKSAVSPASPMQRGYQFDTSFLEHWSTIHTPTYIKMRSVRHVIAHQRYFLHFKNLRSGGCSIIQHRSNCTVLLASSTLPPICHESNTGEVSLTDLILKYHFPMRCI